MDIVDKKIGDVAEVKASQTAGVLSLEVDVTSPISVSGIALGSLDGKLTLGISEVSIIDALEAKYPNVLFVGGAEAVKKILQLL